MWSQYEGGIAQWKEQIEATHVQMYMHWLFPVIGHTTYELFCTFGNWGQGQKLLHAVASVFHAPKTEVSTWL